MPSYTCPIDVDSSVAQTVGELVDALDRSRCVVEVGGCTVTLTAPASMIADAGSQIPQQFEQIVVEGGAEIGLGEVITFLPAGSPIMFFGAFVKDGDIFIASVIPSHEDNLSFQLLCVPSQLARLEILLGTLTLVSTHISLFVLTGSELHKNVYVFTQLCTVRL